MTKTNILTAMRYNKKIIAVTFIILLLTFLLFSSLWNGSYSTPRSYELVYDNIVLKESHQDVPVVIVDQHQEVIPYWYKAVKEGLMKGQKNTLIHIDAHSDMGSPRHVKKLKKFKFHKSLKEREFLPLMQSNDQFLFSAVMEGLIERIIWVKPDWAKDDVTEVKKGHVGTMYNKGEEIFCYCEQLILGRKVLPIECGFHDFRKEMNFTEVPANRCRNIKSYRFVETTESNFVRYLKIKSTVNLFVDIDEDFFGVESGVEHFIQQGISLKTQMVLDVLLPRLYSPRSYDEESKLNKLVRFLFTQIIKIVKNKHEYNEVPEHLQMLIRDQIISSTGRYFRSQDALKEFAIFTLSLTVIELDKLSRVKYCLLHSSRLVDYDSTEFSLCHGNIYPGDKFNELHLSTIDAINKRGKNLQNILEFIYKSTEPKLFTIARSLRDGYTPRSQQKLIERTILRSIDHTVIQHGKRKKIIFDSHLLFGKEGWTEKEHKH